MHAGENLIAEVALAGGGLYLGTFLGVAHRWLRRLIGRRQDPLHGRR